MARGASTTRASNEGAEAPRRGIRRRDAVLGGGIALSSRVGVSVATTNRGATHREPLREIGEMGLGTWSWGNTAVWVRVIDRGGWDGRED